MSNSWRTDRSTVVAVATAAPFIPSEVSRQIEDVDISNDNTTITTLSRNYGLLSAGHNQDHPGWAPVTILTNCPTVKMSRAVAPTAYLHSRNQHSFVTSPAGKECTHQHQRDGRYSRFPHSGARSGTVPPVALTSLLLWYRSATIGIRIALNALRTRAMTDGPRDRPMTPTRRAEVVQDRPG